MNILQNISTEHVIVYGFLLITLIIGLFSSRKVSSIKEYALAGKVFGSGVLTMTMVATHLGANTISTQKSILTYGLIAGIAFIGTVINLIIMGKYVVPKLSRFNDSLTIGDIIQHIYGKYAGMFTTILGTLFSIARIGASLVALGHICNLFLGWDIQVSIAAIGLILVIYSSVGGVKSIALTDVLHFIVFIFVIPIIANIALNKSGGFLNVASKLDKSYLSIMNSPYLIKYLSFFFISNMMMMMMMQPAIIQRVLMAKYNYQARNMLYSSATLVLFLRTIITITCLAVLVIEPSVKPVSGGAFLYIINKYFSPSVRIVGVLAILSILISTIDSVLNAGAVLFTHNFIKPLSGYFKKDLNELKIVKYISFLMGIVSIWVALYNSIEIKVLFNLSIGVFQTLLTIPFIMGILGLKSDDKTFLISSLINLFIFIYLSFFVVDYGKDYIQQPILAISSLITFLTVHFIRHRDFSFIKVNPVVNIISRRIEEINKSGINYSTFALALCIIYAMPFYIPHTHALYPVLILRLVGILLCVGLMLKPYWPTSWNRYFMLYYKFTLFYCLPFLSGIFYFINDSNIHYIIAIVVGMIYLMPVLSWKSFTYVMFFGLSSSALFTYKFLDIPLPLYLGEYTFSFIMVIITFVLCYIFKRILEVNINRKRF